MDFNEIPPNILHRYTGIFSDTKLAPVKAPILNRL